MFTTIINASAGSGKTYKLAIAYLQALLLPQADGSATQPQQVLATTFTRSAASEILERVLRRLAEAVVSEEKQIVLLEEIGRPELGHAELAALLKSICEALPMLQVETIDALFARIIRVIGLDLAFPSAWRVADETEANDLALQAADRMLSGPEATLTRDQWLRYAQFRSRVEVRQKLVELLEHNRFHLVDAPVGADNPDHQRPAILNAEELALTSDALRNFEGVPRTQKGTPHKSWQKAVETLRGQLVEELQLIDLLKQKLFNICGEARGTYYNAEAPETLRKILGPLVERAVEDLGRLHMARLPALAAMAKRYHEFRRVVAYAGAAYGFAEIEAAARLLPEHIEPEDIYFRLDGSVRHLLLDEFQDTSIGQFRFLWQMMREVRSEDRMLFVVGDVKQSIYGWRGADRHLLNHLRGWLDPQQQDSEIHELTLDKNYRSAPAVLQAVHRVFGAMDQLGCLDPETNPKDAKKAQIHRNAALSFAANYSPLTAGGGNAGLAGRVRLLITAKDEAEEETQPEVQRILEAVVEHRREDPQREIAILCRRRKWIPSIIAGLRRRGIEASGEGGSPITDSAAVELVLSMLTWLDHPGHTLARGHVALSGLAPIFGFDPEVTDAFLPKRIQTMLLKTGLAAAIAAWVRADLFRQRCTVHDQVRCEQLVEMARHWDAAGGGRLAHFVERVREQKRDNPVASRVRVMTIHGSKGLEFDVVILADMQGKSGGGGDAPSFLVEMISPEEPPSIQLVPTDEHAEILGYQEVTDRHHQNQFEEDLSVLYVALTRAKSFLDVVLIPEKSGPTLPGILCEAWGQNEPGTHVVEENPARIVKETTQPVMAHDEAVWEKTRGYDLKGFRPVPERLDAITPSGQEGAGRMKIGQLLSSGNKVAMERGTAIHELVAQVEWLGALPSVEEWVRSVPQNDECRTAARKLHVRLSEQRGPLAQIFEAAAWLAKWKPDGVKKLEVWRERRFVVVLDHELMNGSFDRVVCGLDATGKIIRAEILDFKTDRLDSAAARDERGLFYQPQLDAYARAFTALTGLPAVAIKTLLVWID